MKSGIHPDYVETTVHCGCGNTFTTRSTKKGGQIARRGLLSVPSLLHRQAEDSRQRRPCRPLREALRQAQSGERRRRRHRQIAFCPTPDPLAAATGVAWR